MPPFTETTLAAIDVGTNAVRIELARPTADGTLTILHEERDPVRPGEGVFTDGVMPGPVMDRVLSTLRRYGAICRRHGATVRAVATSAVREARNGGDLVRRARREAGLRLEVISGEEEARLTCLGVLSGKPPRARSLCLDIGGGSTELATAVGERPLQLWSVDLGAVRIAQLFDTMGEVTPKKLKLLRGYVRETVDTAFPSRVDGFPRVALGCSGTIRAIIGFAAGGGGGRATARELRRAVDDLAAMGPARLRRQFDPRRAEIIVPGAVILESIARHLSLDAVTAIPRGLRHGVILDLRRRLGDPPDRPDVASAAIALGRSVSFDEAHATQVARIALSLYDALEEVHGLPAAARPVLEAAALLHDVGQTLSHARHHRHAEYMIENATLAGLADRDRLLAARVARYHRRSPPAVDHPGMLGLATKERELVLRLAVLLRLADALDRSHLQAIDRVRVSIGRRAVALRLRAARPVDLELWDAAREGPLFERVFGAALSCRVAQ